MRIIWDLKKYSNYLENFSNPSKLISELLKEDVKLDQYFIIHYTFDENDPRSVDFSIIVNSELLKKNEINIQATWLFGFSDLLPSTTMLLPASNYRIMIEIQNAEHNGVYGTYFNCQTPSELTFPSPEDFNVLLIRETENDAIKLHFTWKNIKFQALANQTHRNNNFYKVNVIDGYVIYLIEKNITALNNKSSIRKYFSEGLLA